MKRKIIILFCITLLAFLATSCYTSKKCAAYGYSASVAYETTK